MITKIWRPPSAARELGLSRRHLLRIVADLGIQKKRDGTFVFNQENLERMRRWRDKHPKGSKRRRADAV